MPQRHAANVTGCVLKLRRHRWYYNFICLPMAPVSVCDKLCRSSTLLILSSKLIAAVTSSLLSVRALSHILDRKALGSPLTKDYYYWSFALWPYAFKGRSTWYALSLFLCTWRPSLGQQLAFVFIIAHSINSLVAQKGQWGIAQPITPLEVSLTCSLHPNS